ncbi:MAG: flagellin FliC [Myxococcales bacterium]|nr:flagellin FliC [Myxococcales bacterium]
MALYIQTNVSSLMAQSNLSKTQNSLQTSFQRLSSGFRINSAADDAAGLGISDSMTAQIRSYAVAERNAMDGISMSQTADGASSQVGAMLARMRELAMQARNGSYTATDRGNLDVEFQQLTAEIDRMAQSVSFNGTALLNGTTTVSFQVGIGTTAADQVSVTFGGLTSSTLGVAGTDVTSAVNAGTAITAIDTAIATVSTKRATFGAAMNRLQTTVQNIQSMKNNLSAANSRIRDVDVAEESSQMSRTQVLAQAGAAVLSQANQAPQLALSLLK